MWELAFGSAHARLEVIHSCRDRWMLFGWSTGRPPVPGGSGGWRAAQLSVPQPRAQLPRPRIAYGRDLPEVGRRAGGIGAWPEVGVPRHDVQRVRQVEHLGEQLKPRDTTERDAPAHLQPEREERRALTSVARDVGAIHDRPARRALEGRDPGRDDERRRRLGLQDAAQLETV
jgi:hypothetical protein